jgi:hypothetical protein
MGWVKAGLEKTWECVLPLPVCPPRHSLFLKPCPVPRCGLTIPKFTETFTSLYLKILLLLFQSNDHRHGLWLKLVILATWEAEMGGSQFEASLGEIVQEPPFPK